MGTNSKRSSDPVVCKKYKYSETTQVWIQYKAYHNPYGISRVYENPQGVLRSFNEFSPFMRSFKQFLRLWGIIEGPREKIKIVASNHNLKYYLFNKPKICHQLKREKTYQCPLCFSTSNILS